MTRVKILVFLSLVVSLTASAQRGPVFPPFGGTVTRIPVQATQPMVAPPQAQVESAGNAPATAEQPDFDIYTKDSLGDDHGKISPAIVFGYKNVRSSIHPWAIEAGYKYIDSTGGHLDLLLGTAWATAWLKGDDNRNESFTFEEDASDLRGIQTRFDTYVIAEAVRSPLTVDLLAGITSARNAGAGRTTDFMAGVLPILQVSKLYSVVALYAIKNDVDGEDYYEVSVARSFERPAFQLSIVAAKHGTYAIRFQKTLKHFTRIVKR